MAGDETKDLKHQIAEDRKLIRRAERALAEIDRNEGLSDEHADVLAALRIRLEGKPRATLEDLLGAAGDISGRKDLTDVLEGEPGQQGRDWPEVEEKKRDWPS